MLEYQLEREFTLEISAIDSRGIARPSAIVEYMQECATRHADELGLSGIEVNGERVLWVLSRLKYYLNRPLHQYDTIRVRTWPRTIRGALWYRDFRFFMGEEEIGHAVTGWSILSADQHKLIRPKALQVDIPTQMDGIDELLSQIPCEAMQPVFDRTVHYSDIDVNRHLNNVKAVDILSDAIGLEHHENWFVSELQVNYKAETACGTTLTLRRGEQDGKILLQAMAGEQENLQAQVTVSTV
ncbi:MAG: acyl-[acyl-carrier-protein] thioesterase [Butyricicoccus sp.]